MLHVCLHQWMLQIILTINAKCGSISVSGGDVRIAKGHYTRGDDIVRLSVIGDGKESVSPPMAYHAPFVHRWSTKMLHSQLVNVSETSIVVDGNEIRLELPSTGMGTTGLLIADPCFTGRGGIACPNGDRMKTLDHLTKIINQLVGSAEFDFWGIVGDNLYDQHGDVTSEFFQQISAAAKAKPFITVPGNHDFWISGGPVGSKADQLGYGFMQFFGQDTPGAIGSTPYNFQGNPDALQIASGENFIFSTQIGDVAFFGYSAAHGWSVAAPHAEEFCNYVGNTTSVHVAVILGHWNEVNLGCMAGMDTPSMYDKMIRMEGCKSKRLLYFDGHQHCNRVTKQTSGPSDAVGFMIGGAGMDGDCTPQFGFTVLQSLPQAPGGPNVRVDYFQVAEDPSWGKDPSGVVDSFDEMFACLSQHGYSGCRDKYATPFRSVPAPTTAAPTSDGPDPAPATTQGPGSGITATTYVICGLALVGICLMIVVARVLW
eukprot:CAMPEP_0169353432 /NCGR_PEP_ID=MMETSP1017-20121227/25884_1 /TAXON_ID=342587 /ORGANISM="Karlodinium micrum, Strain CCMP2283" /LENGTH=484 /DNA_ID=CAMNT_0009449909 /DNA_START=46 /DNA_END=1497 /DNA_ORIENTATION=+